jgi:ABC-2 type transport system permease protein
VETIKAASRRFIKYIPLLRELVIRDLKVKYRRSFLGYLWSLLNPLMMMLVMNFVFSKVFRFEVPNFLLYLICGQTLFTFFNESTNMSMYAILGNSALMKKIYIPRFIFPISRVISSFVTMSFSLVAILIVMVFTGVSFHPAMLLIVAPIFFLFLFSCGMSMILSALAVYFRDVTHLYGVFTLAWMYATPIFYPIEAVGPSIQAVIKLNPLYHYINVFRNLVMYGNIPGPNAWFACIASSVAVLTLGLFLFNRLQKNFILYI